MRIRSMSLKCDMLLMGDRSSESDIVITVCDPVFATGWRGNPTRCMLLLWKTIGGVLRPLTARGSHAGAVRIGRATPWLAIHFYDRRTHLSRSERSWLSRHVSTSPTPHASYASASRPSPNRSNCSNARSGYGCWSGLVATYG